MKWLLGKKGDDKIVVARKEGLALGWERLDRRTLGLNATIVLQRPCVLAGTVVDETGRAISGANIRVCLARERLNGLPFHIPEDWFSTRTDAKGRFSFNNIPRDASADFWVEFPGRASFWTCQTWDSHPGRQFPAERRDIRIVMPPEARIEGQVVDTIGKGVPGIRLLARADRGQANYYSPELIASGEDGGFCFQGLLADTYSVQVVSPEEGMAEWVGGDSKVVCRAGQTTENVIVKVNRGRIIELAVQDAASKQPLGGVWFSVSQEASFGRHPGFYRSGRTGSDGQVRLRAPLGVCQVSAGGWGYSIFRSNLPLTAAKGKTSRLEILLDRDPLISGTVEDKTGRPVHNVLVDVLPVSNGADQTDARGKFKVSWRGANSPPRKYVLAQHAQRNLAAIVEIKDESKPLNIVLRPGLLLAGQVTDPDGVPIPAARVQLAASLPRWLTRIGAEVTTNAQGHYQISSIPAAVEGIEYRINVNASGYAPLEYKRFSLTETSEQRCEDRTFVLEPANLSISGVVIDHKGNPVPGKMIHLSGPRGGSGQPSGQTVTNANGEFFFGRVCRGPLRLQAGYGDPGKPGGPGFLDAQGGDEKVKIVLGQRGVHEKYVSLLDKTLPLLKDLRADIKAKQVKNKRIAVCFWDMEQRPSRRCIKELAKITDSLAKKNVVVVAVHASAVESEKLKQWLKDSNIELPVGQIPADAVEKTCAAWGVRSLPWLILTDRQHIVRAEGFPLAELDEKLKQIDGN